VDEEWSEWVGQRGAPKTPAQLIHIGINQQFTKF
jgi:hypothetical protein